MPLERGKSLGPYEIIELIGAGGMGEVYRAKDRRLNRTIAIKVLPAHVANRSDAKHRFEREAQAIAALNHPHICVLHDIGCDDGVDYLVMEHLEGETLAQRLSRGKLLIADTLKFSMQIIDALDKAHRQGVVHRDLKPGNIMLTKSGAKLLDFGLAKLKHTADLPGENLQSVSLLSTGSSVTRQDTIIGTLQYMSPEQVEAKEADARSDIFAFGAIVYEMVTGKRAFDGSNQAAVMTKILEHDPPPLSSLEPTTPRLLTHVVNRCLAKTPDSRWQNAADVLIELEAVVEIQETVTTSTKDPQAKPSREKMAWGLALLFAAAAITAIIAGMLPRAPGHESSVVRLQVDTPVSVLGSPIVLSPDGKRFAMVETSDGIPRLWVRSLDQLSGHILPGTDGAGTPFWSPDSHFIGFFADGKLKKVDLYGAPPQLICDAPGIPLGGSWNADGMILLGSDAGLMRVSAGGSPEPAVELDESRSEISHAQPFFLPDGRHFLFLARSRKPENNAIFVGDLKTATRKFVVNSEVQAVFALPDHLLYLRGVALMRQAFDLSRLAIHGDPVKIADEIILGPSNGYATFSVSATGHMAYRTGSDVILGREVGIVDRAGKQIGAMLATGSGNYMNPVFSPDGQSVAIHRRELGSDIWIYTEGGAGTKLTFDPADDDFPVWSPDGKTILFSSNRETGIANLYTKPSGGGRQEELLLKSDHPKTPTGWSRNGFIVYEDYDSRTGADLMVLPMTGGRQFEFLRTPANERQATFSPDGNWIAYISDSSGRAEVYVRSFPPSGTQWQISTAGGFQPRWSADGKELFYLSPVADDQFVAVDVLSKPSDTEFRFGSAEKLFIVNVFTGGRPGPQRNSYDVSRDGRFLVNGGLGASASSLNPVVTLILNWASELRN